MGGIKTRASTSRRRCSASQRAVLNKLRPDGLTKKRRARLFGGEPPGAGSRALMQRSHLAGTPHFLFRTRSISPELRRSHLCWFQALPTPRRTFGFFLCETRSIIPPELRSNQQSLRTELLAAYASVQLCGGPRTSSRGE